MTMQTTVGKTTDKKEIKAFALQRKCRFITCIHCINERCTANKCDMYENDYIQEG